MKKVPVGILGATGMVGQQLVQKLVGHPFFEITFLASSEQSAGKTYGEAIAGRWHFEGTLPENIKSMPVHSIDAIDKANCRAVFSALTTDAAKIYEERYAAAGFAVISNASVHRLSPDVPMLIPECNADHLEAIALQQKNRGWDKGFIVVKPNCSLQSYLLPLYPLHLKFKIKKLVITTLQAISGAGFPGVASFSINDNVIPYIGGEEEKSEIEPLKILGKLQAEGILPATDISIAAHCNRVPVIDGHLACVSVQFEVKPKREEILEIWRDFKGQPQLLNLPHAPLQPIIYREEPDRPQPRLDRHADKGMAVSVGRLRECPVFDYRFTGLSHNTVRGAAGGAILNAELLYAKGYLQ